MRFLILVVAALLTFLILETHSVQQDRDPRLLAKIIMEKVKDAMINHTDIELIFAEDFQIRDCNKRTYRREEAIKWIDKHPTVHDSIKLKEAGILLFPRTLLALHVSISLPEHRSPIQLWMFVEMPERPYPNEVISIGPIVSGHQVECPRNQ